ncbi:endonuclease domain-containing protein [Microbacterium sp. zg-YB36]|uniref:endonuclease domain-containing protein n=1 Tax=Microbacterium sp. zg-YB36 TaxID=2969407 RepID=UPI00214B4BDE|nr:endonuclease domain-containing protein [Microbacterium sp. zg-YB36]MDL5352971.1 endonuclease domain-containing protein [Microbacterium sp. zg-YB36]
MRSTTELTHWLAAQGGGAHSTALKAAGFSTHAIRVAVQRGAVARVRRSWLVAGDCTPDVRRAAEAGGRLTCVTAAARANLWTPSHEGIHIAVAPTASRVTAEGVHLHWAQGPAPVGKASLFDPLVNVLFQVARCLPMAEALCVWESAIRQKSVHPAVLARIQWRGEAARAIAAAASDLSDSGVETRFVLLMRSIGVAVRQQVWIDGHPVDGLIGEHLVVQIDGFAHHQARDRRRDLSADARLVLLGYTVLRFDYYQVLFQPEQVIAVISAAIAQGLHR